jgi:hypothetical protein
MLTGSTLLCLEVNNTRSPKATDCFDILAWIVLYISGSQPMVREKLLVVRGEMWTLFAIFMFIILFHYIIILLQTNSNRYYTDNFVIIKQVHFILIKWNFYDRYFIDICTI